MRLGVKGKQSFFEKKDQKTFSPAVAEFSCKIRDSMHKFFASFFQKRRPFFTAASPRSAP
jgi:hypothetical protein